MKPSSYCNYSKIFDSLSNPLIYPDMVDFLKYIYAISSYKSSMENNQKIKVCDVGSGTGYFVNSIFHNNHKVELTLIEPSIHMLPILKERFKGSNAKIISSHFDEAIGRIDSQDVFIFQRSLYSFSGNIEYYLELVKKLEGLTKKDGVIAVFEIPKKYNIDEMKEFFLKNRSTLNFPDNEFEPSWEILKKALIEFNEGILCEKYTLFDVKRLQYIFSSNSFVSILRKKNYSFFKKV